MSRNDLLAESLKYFPNCVYDYMPENEILDALVDFYYYEDLTDYDPEAIANEFYTVLDEDCVNTRMVHISELKEVFSMKIDLFNVEKQTAATVFGFLMDSVPSEDLEKLDFYLCQEAQDDSFNMAFSIVKPHFHITLFSDRLEIENSNSVCKIPCTEYSHIEIY